MISTILIGSAGAVAAGSLEVSSTDLSSSGRCLDNVKGSWSQHFSSKLIPGDGLSVSAKYNRKKNKNFLEEASLSGTLDKIKYALTSKFDGGVEASVETTMEDGTNFVAEGSMDSVYTLSNLKLTKVQATRGLCVKNFLSGQSQDCSLEVSHDLPSSESKVKLSTVLGSGLTVIGQLTSKDGSSGLSYEVEYDTKLMEGRTLHATVSPSDGTGEIEYEDSATLDATITATLPLGGKPSVTVKRSFGF